MSIFAFVMKRIMAIDFGTKKTGIAVTDELQLIASGLTTVETSQLIAFFKAYFEKESVETVVVGLPKRLNNEDSAVEKNILEFIKEFEKEFPSINIARQDERFTSKMAFQTMIDSGLKKNKRKNKALVDEIAATIILQSYMERRSFL